MIYIIFVYNFLCHDSYESSHELKFRISSYESSHELTTMFITTKINWNEQSKLINEFIEQSNNLMSFIEQYKQA